MDKWDCPVKRHAAWNSCASLVIPYYLSFCWKLKENEIHGHIFENIFTFLNLRLKKIYLILVNIVMNIVNYLKDGTNHKIYCF